MRRVWALFLGLAVVAGAFETVVTVPSMKAPRIDSVIEASEWNGTFSQELVKLDGEKPKAATLFQMGCDKENLYLAFTCFESEVKKMRRIHTHIEERDGPIYNDDCVELFFDPFGNDNEGIFHFAINSNGIFYDAFNGDASFQSDIKIACSVGEDRWTAEIAIPFSDFGIQPRGAETIRVNVGRERQVAPPEYTCLGTGTGGFHSRDRLRRFRPVPEGSQPPPVTFLAFGSREFPELLMQNTAADDNDTYPVSIERLDENMKAIGTLEAACGRELSKAEYATPGDRKVFGYKYEITGKSGDGRYSGVFMFPKATVAAKLHTMKIAKPLFKELFSRR